MRLFLLLLVVLWSVACSEPPKLQVPYYHKDLVEKAPTDSDDFSVVTRSKFKVVATFYDQLDGRAGWTKKTEPGGTLPNGTHWGGAIVWTHQPEAVAIGLLEEDKGTQIHIKISKEEAALSF